MAKRTTKTKASVNQDLVIGSPVAPPAITPQALKEREDLDRCAKKQIIDHREEYASTALGVFQAWVGFTIVFIIAQLVLTVIEKPLPTPEFIAVVVTSATSIVGLAYTVGKFLFPTYGSKDMFR